MYTTNRLITMFIFFLHLASYKWRLSTYLPSPPVELLIQTNNENSMENCDFNNRLKFFYIIMLIIQSFFKFSHLVLFLLLVCVY